MKLFKLMFPVITISLFFSCATTENNGAVETTTVTEEETPNLVEVIEETKVYFPLVEKSFYGDGQVDTITTYTYDDNFNLLKRVVTNEQDEVLETEIYNYNNGQLVRRDNYGFANQLNSYTVYTYNTDGLVSEESLFDKEEKVQSINSYEYTNGLVTTWRTLGAEGGVLAITNFIYNKDGNLTKIEIRDSGSVLDGVIEKEYDGALVTKEVVKDSKGSIEKTNLYSYENDILKEVVFKDGKDKVTRSESYIFSEGKPVPDKITQHYRSGAIESYTEITYDFKIETSSKWVEE